MVMLIRGYFTRKDKPDVIVPFMFNPTEFTVEKGNQYAEINIPGLSSSLLQFVKGNSRTISMDLFFDTYETGTDVREHTDKITGWDAGSMYSKIPGEKKGLMDIDSELHAPPVCIFVWGKFAFQCIIDKVTKKFTLFLPEGIPVRATLSVSLKEYREVDIQVKELDLHSSDITKQWEVTQGDSLWAISAKEYGDPAQWRLIAKANGIDNPRELTPGQELVIPKKE
jgi:nucleoid-associated protein YgaU